MSDPERTEAHDEERPIAGGEPWVSHWEEGQTGWHRDEVHPVLRAHVGSWQRVLVPLCGASLDLAWLTERDMDVVGVELAEIACRRLFTQWGREPAVDTLSAAGQSYTRYQASRLTVLQGDMLALGTEHAGRADAVWDRGSLVALDPSLRPAYQAALSRVAPGAELLLVTFAYDDGVMSGPPFSISEAYIRDSYDEVEPLGDEDMTGVMREQGMVPDGAGDQPLIMRQAFRARIRPL